MDKAQRDVLSHFTPDPEGTVATLKAIFGDAEAALVLEAKLKRHMAELAEARKGKGGHHDVLAHIVEDPQGWIAEALKTHSPEWVAGALAAKAERHRPAMEAAHAAGDRRTRAEREKAAREAKTKADAEAEALAKAAKPVTPPEVAKK